MAKELNICGRHLASTIDPANTWQMIRENLHSKFVKFDTYVPKSSKEIIALAEAKAHWKEQWRPNERIKGEINKRLDGSKKSLIFHKIGEDGNFWMHKQRIKIVDPHNDYVEYRYVIHYHIGKKLISRKKAKELKLIR